MRKKEKQLIIIKDKKAITLTIIFLIILSIIMFKNFEIRNKDYTKIAECLVEKGVIMAGTETCHYCKAQKEMFNGAFEEVFAIKGNYKDCNNNKEWCEENKIRGYPTWLFPDGTRLEGVQKIEVLAKANGCELES